LSAETLLGLLLFAGRVGPGCVRVRVCEVRRPQQQRSQILEAAELVFVGLLATGAASLAVLSLANAWDGLGVDTSRLAAEGGDYLLVEPLRGIGTILAALLLAFVAARLNHREAPTILPGYSVCDRLFRLGHQDVRVYAAVEGRHGRRFAGSVSCGDVGSAGEDRELALASPLPMQSRSEPAVELGPRSPLLSVRRDGVVWPAVSPDPPPEPRHP